MKKLFLTGISLLFALTLTFAQEKTPEDKAKAVVTELTEKLTLTEDQQKSIYEIVLDSKKSKAALKADATLSPEVLSESIDKLKATTDAQIAEKLSDEQKTLYEKIVSERKNKETPVPVETQEQSEEQPAQQ